MERTRHFENRHILLCGILILLITAAAMLFTAQPVSAADAEDNAETWTVTQYGPRGFSVNNMFYALHSSKGRLILIDSGTKSSAKIVEKVIKDNGGKVDLWILTHPHYDHVNAFISLSKKGLAKKYDIKKVLVQYYPKNVVNHTFAIDRATYKSYVKALKKYKNVKTFHGSTKTSVGSLKIQFYSAYSHHLYQQTVYRKYSFNTYSGAFMVSAKSGKKMFFGGDITGPVINRLINQYGKKLRADYLQLPHHGNEYNTERLLHTVKPEVVLIDHPDRSLTPELRTNKTILKKLNVKYFMTKKKGQRTLNLY